MISVIICSTNNVLLSQVKKNIEDTIGTEFELLFEDNKLKNDGISTVYNRLAGQSKFNYLVFLHEDVIIHSKDWGFAIREVLQQEKAGLVGISGAVYKSKIPAAWSQVPEKYYRVNAIQHWNTAKSDHIRINPENEKYSKAAVIDGVFMATRKNVWQNNPFDNHTFNEFHFYDMDFSLTIGKHYDVLVTYDILLEHLSPGTINDRWVHYSRLFYKKWSCKLPVATVPLSKSEFKKLEYQSWLSYLFLVAKSKYTKTYFLFSWIKFMFKFPISKENLKPMYYFLVVNKNKFKAQNNV